MIITTDIDLALREQTALTPLEQVFILVDENTRVHSLPIILKTLPLPAEQILCIPAGEAHKTLHTVELIWQFLEQRNATRHSLLFCLGGGVAANPALRAAYEHMCQKEGVALIMPPLSSCGDNAGMIALVALDRYNARKFHGYDCDAQAHANLDEPY